MNNFNLNYFKNHKLRQIFFDYSILLIMIETQFSIAWCIFLIFNYLLTVVAHDQNNLVIRGWGIRFTHLLL